MLTGDGIVSKNLFYSLLWEERIISKNLFYSLLWGEGIISKNLFFFATLHLRANNHTELKHKYSSTPPPLFYDHPSEVKKVVIYKSVTSFDRYNLVLLYYLSASEIWLDKRGVLLCQCPYKRVTAVSRKNYFPMAKISRD